MSEAWTPSPHGRDGGLRKRVARGLMWTLIDTWGSQMLGLITFVILSRLLLPVDFGLVALATVFVALGQLFVDQGLGDAVIQRPTVTRRQLDTAFWASMLTGAVLSAAGILLAGPLATLLGDQRLEPILQALSLVFVLVALSSIQLGILRREMDFRRLAARKLLAVGLSGVIGIALALMGYGAWALVGQQLAQAGISVIALWAVSPWRPSFSFSTSDFRSLFGYGLNVVGSDLLGFLSRYTDNLLIGVFLGPVALGFYAVAYRILDTSSTLLVAAARRLVFPSFARLQHDMKRIRRAYLRLAQLSGAITVPGYVGLALVANEAIVFIFGERWAPSAAAATILFLIGPAVSFQAFSGAVWNAIGHPEVTLRFRLVSTVTSIIGFVIAVVLFRDIVAVAAAFAIRGYLLVPLNVYWMRVYGGVSVREQLLQLRGIAAATAVMAAVVLAVKFSLGGQLGNGVLLAVEVAAGVLAFGVALFVLERPLVREFASLASQVVPGGEKLAARAGVDVNPRREAQEGSAGPPVADEEPDDL